MPPLTVCRVREQGKLGRGEGEGRSQKKNTLNRSASERSSFQCTHSRDALPHSISDSCCRTPPEVLQVRHLASLITKLETMAPKSQ